MSTAVDAEVAALVREVLAEEVARFRAARGTGSRHESGAREERVRIRSDADLREFTARLLAMAEDAEARRALADGRLVFRLDEEQPPRGGGAHPPAAVHSPGPGRVEIVERGLFSERRAERLPPETTHVRLGRTVKMTPLARDRLRRRGIVIERTQR